MACLMDADRLRTNAAQEGEQGDPMGEDGNPLPPQDGLSQHLLCKAYFDERAAQYALVSEWSGGLGAKGQGFTSCLTRSPGLPDVCVACVVCDIQRTPGPPRPLSAPPLQGLP